VFGIFKEGYTAHGYKEWLIGNVSGILGDTLNISSAGLLRQRAIAWVEISVPDTILTPEGVAFRPNLLATTSLDGSIATTYKRTVTLTVCDNTREAALAEDGQTYKRRHTRYSAGKLEQDKAREALNLIHETADAVSAELARMCAIPVTDLEFSKVLDIVIPIDKDTTKTGLTVANRKREEMSALYRNDKRVAPWNGTAFGVVQASNTWHHHVKGTRGETHRPERNMLAAINGDTGKSDSKVWDAIVKVLELQPA
jgi:phage/plasmid-like protein (TIGR03299 family)